MYPWPLNENSLRPTRFDSERISSPLVPRLRLPACLTEPPLAVRGLHLERAVGRKKTGMRRSCNSSAVLQSSPILPMRSQKGAMAPTRLRPPAACSVRIFRMPLLCARAMAHCLPNDRTYSSTCHASSSVNTSGTNEAISVPGLPFLRIQNSSPSDRAACQI